MGRGYWLLTKRETRCRGSRGRLWGLLTKIEARGRRARHLSETEARWLHFHVLFWLRRKWVMSWLGASKSEPPGTSLTALSILTKQCTGSRSARSTERKATKGRSWCLGRFRDLSRGALLHFELLVILRGCNRSLGRSTGAPKRKRPMGNICAIATASWGSKGER